jgi:hypothetical protein
MGCDGSPTRRTGNLASSVGQQLARKMERTQAELLRARRTAVTAGAMELKQGVQRRLPASGRLRGVGKKGARVGVRYDLKGDTEAVVKAIGPLHLLENATAAHDIQPKKRRGKGGNAALKLPDGSFRGVIHHPGTKGQKPFAKGIEDARPKALRAMANPITDAVKRGIRG